MERYRDWDQDSGVHSFEIGESHIDVEFKTGSAYRYTEESVGTDDLNKMISLARAGEGLNSFINKVVRRRYSEKLR